MNTAISSVPISDRITKIQNRLFERAHAQPLELKFLAISLSRQGIQGDKLYTHPEMIPLPMRNCDYLYSLSPRQKAIISAAYFANFYKAVANSESQTLVSNIGVAEKVFAPYSDEYMILHQETSEEMDHIWSFRTVHSMVCRETGVQDSFNEPGFFCGKVGAIPQADFDAISPRFTLDADLKEILANLTKSGTFLRELTEQLQWQSRSWRYRILRFLIGDAVRLLPAEKVQEYGLGGLWLLYRYISNVELKQAEAYLLDAPEKFDYEPLALEINQGHLMDEARHYTTSYDLGLELYRAASPEAQEFICLFLKKVTEDYISASFLTFLEMLDVSEQGVIFTNIDLGLTSLRMAMHHPDFANRQADLNALVHSWKQMKWRKIVSHMTQKRWRYIAQQLDRMNQELGIELNTVQLGNLYERYKNALQTSAVESFIEVA